MHHVVVTRREVQSRVLRHRERIHVASQHHGGPGFAAGEQGRNSTGGVVQGDVERKTFERLQYGVASVGQMVANLGPFVQATAQSDGTVIQIVNVRRQLVSGAVNVTSSECLGVLCHGLIVGRAPASTLGTIHVVVGR